MIKAIDAHKLRQMKKIRAKVVRFSIVLMTMVVVYLLHLKFQSKQRQDEFDVLINGFQSSYNDQTYASFYKGFCHPGLQKTQTETQYVAAMSRIQRILGAMDSIKLASYKPATEAKPYHIFLYEMMFKSGQFAVLHLAFSQHGSKWLVFAWKVTARDLAKNKP